ncbi:proteinase-activated receptor 1-like [Lineus longissimus]|uniref:proteinase-activated receptor 1-like n=1 Tax=Lineus longissimus TaxID=88925 RepID=UPI00315DB8CB
MATTRSVDDALSEEEARISSIVLFTLNKILPPAVIVGGLVGNLLIYLVLKQPQYSKQTTCFFMRMLAICDTTSLGHNVIRTVIAYHPTFMLLQSGSAVCPIMAAFTCVYGLSNWTTAAMTFDRFLAVRYPLKVASWSTMRRCRMIVGCIVILEMSVLIPYSFRTVDETALVMKEICTFLPVIPVAAYSVLHGLQSYGLFTTPFCLIFIFNISIITTLIQEKIRKRKSMLTSSGKTSQDGQITLMLLLVTSVFFVTNLPFTFDQLIWDPNQVLTPRLAMIRKITYEFEVFLLFLNPSVNFYTYCLGSKKFRQDVSSVLKRALKLSVI